MMKHTKDFKQEAVRIALTSGLSRRRVAADLGIELSTLGKWVSQYRQLWPSSHDYGVEGGRTRCRRAPRRAIYADQRDQARSHSQVQGHYQQ